LHYFIPAINTDIRFTSVLPTYDVKKSELNAIDVKTLPVNFNWSFEGESDTEEMKKKKRLINPVTNQGLCGYCWALGTVTTLGDNFVVRGLIDWSPYISSTYALACYPQNQCNGGNNGVLCLDIMKGGITSITCLDSSFCEFNVKCFKKPTEANIQPVSGDELNKFIPTCGCYFSGEYYFYYIDSASVITVAKNEFTNTTADTVKKFIYKNGPAIGGFIVFDNFRMGHFTEINGGVYFENGVYTDSSGLAVKDSDFKFDEEQTSATNYIGTHAVSIVGWGVEKNILVDNKGKREDVPYWFCRNSWSKYWGDQGFFKIAMYPYNQIAQLDKLITIIDSDILSKQGYVEGGGIILMDIKDPPKKKFVEVSNDIKGIKRSYPDAFYQNPDDRTKEFPAALKEEFGFKEKFCDNNGKSSLLINYALIVILLLLLVFFSWRC
jgi:hypothetical protein